MTPFTPFNCTLDWSITAQSVERVLFVAFLDGEAGTYFQIEAYPNNNCFLALWTIDKDDSAPDDICPRDEITLRDCMMYAENYASGRGWGCSAPTETD